MTWSIRILPLEREAFLEALANYDVVHGSAADQQMADDARNIVTMMLDEDTLADSHSGQLYDCSIVGHASPEAASLSINVYRRRVEAQPQPAEASEAEVTPAAEEPPTEEVTSEE